MSQTLVNNATHWRALRRSHQGHGDISVAVEAIEAQESGHDLQQREEVAGRSRPSMLMGP